MPNISDRCDFVASSSKIYFQTNTNGDTITMAGIQLTPEQAASLSWLLNNEQELSVRIKLNT